jgi:putative spermidine/putrescine transport system permease protein
MAVIIVAETRHGRPSRWLLGAYSGLVAAFLLAPLAAAVLMSFSSGDKLELPLPGLSLRWYAAAARTEQFISGLWLSTVIAGFTAIFSAIAGTTAAIAINHYRFRGRGSIQGFLMLPLAMPWVVIGLGILFTLPFYGMHPGAVAAIFGHSAIGIPYVVYLVLATLSNYDLSLEHASLNLGAGRWQTFRNITLPLIAPGVMAGTISAFLVSFDNVSISLFITRNDTLPLRLMQYIQFYANPSVAAVSSFLVALSLVAVMLAGQVLRKRDFDKTLSS